MQRLIIAYEAGRKVDLNQILQHEPVPIALAGMNGDLRTAEALTENIKCLTDLPAGDLKDGATLMTDGMAFLLLLVNHKALQHLVICPIYSEQLSFLQHVHMIVLMYYLTGTRTFPSNQEPENNGRKAQDQFGGLLRIAMCPCQMTGGIS